MGAAQVRLPFSLLLTVVSGGTLGGGKYGRPTRVPHRAFGQWMALFFVPLMWLFLALVCNTAQGGEVVNSNVEHHEGRFDVYAEILINLPEPDVRAILIDYEELPQVNDGIKQVRILERRGGSHARMRVVSEVCLFLLCLDYSWVQDVDTLSSGDIVAMIDPHSSNFQEGRALWRLLPENSHTRLIFDAQLIPDFWFPPSIGTWVVRRKLHSAALKTALGVERVAAGRGQEKP